MSQEQQPGQHNSGRGPVNREEAIKRLLELSVVGSGPLELVRREAEGIIDALGLTWPCPECHGNGFVNRSATSGTGSTGGFTVWNEPCPRGCSPPQVRL